MAGLVVAISPEPTAEEAEVVAAVLALMNMAASHDGDARITARSRWAEAGRRAARRGKDQRSGWGRPVGDQATGAERATGGWR